MKKLIIALAIVFGMSPGSNATEERKDQTLTIRQQKVIIISSFTAKGDLDHLKIALDAALESGLTVNEIKETIVHLYAYCGFPRSICGLQTLMKVLEERKAKGIIDKWGKQASPIKDERSKYERGKTILEKLTGTPQNGPRTGYAALSPEIEIFLKEHLFADIFERDILSFMDRELVTISALSSIGGAEPMLNSHFGICLNIGISPDQLLHFINVINAETGKKEAENARLVLEEVLKTKNKIINKK